MMTLENKENAPLLRRKGQENYLGTSKTPVSIPTPEPTPTHTERGEARPIEVNVGV